MADKTKKKIIKISLNWRSLYHYYSVLAALNIDWQNEADASLRIDAAAAAAAAGRIIDFSPLLSLPLHSKFLLLSSSSPS